MTDFSHSSDTGHSGQVVGKQAGTDRRSRRTRRLLGEALLSLLREKPYRSITIQDITGRADVGRSTFYEHYRDKDDLLAADVGDMLARMVLPLNALGVIDVQPLFEHVTENHDLLRALMRGQILDRVFREGQRALAQRLEPMLRDDGVPPAVAAQHLAGSVLNLLRWWLENGQPYPPEEMDRLFQRLTRLE